MSPEEKKARADFLRKKARAAELRGLSSAPAQPQEEEPPSMTDRALEYGGRALDMGFRTLDMPGGFVRTAYKGLQNIPRAAAKGLDAIGIENEYADKPHLVTTEDYKRALEGRAPTMSEFAEREGAEPGLATGAAGMAGDILFDPLTYMTFGTSALRRGAERTGKALYKSGLKELDIEASFYDKEPVSDLLMREGVTGSAEQIQKRMDDLAAGYLKERDSILKEATKLGAEVDMGEAMAPLLGKIQQMKNSGDPNLVKVASVMEKDAQKYLAKGAREGEDIIRELPVSAEYKAPYRAVTSDASRLGLPIGKVQPPDTVAKTKYQRSKPALEKVRGPYSDEFKQMINDPNINVEMGQMMPAEYISRAPVKVMDKGVMIDGPMGKELVERVAGPTPMQASGWKSSAYSQVGGPAYELTKRTPAGKDLLKSKAYGLKTATETAVGKVMPNQKQELIELNQKLGQILTTDEKAMREAAKEIRKNKLTSVDAILYGATTAATGNPAKGAATLLLKKAADAAKGTKFRTTKGKALIDRAKNEMLLERNLLTSPWLELNRMSRKPESEQE